MRHLERSVIVACRAKGRFWGPVPWRDDAWEPKRGFATRYFTQEGADEAFVAAEEALKAEYAESLEQAPDIAFEYWEQREKQAAD